MRISPILEEAYPVLVEAIREELTSTGQAQKNARNLILERGIAQSIEFKSDHLGDGGVVIQFYIEHPDEKNNTEYSDYLYLSGIFHQGRLTKTGYIYQNATKIVADEVTNQVKEGLAEQTAD